MYRRFTQYEPRSHNIEVLAPDNEFASGIDEMPIERYNIIFFHREYGLTETQNLHFLFMPHPAKEEHKTWYSLSPSEHAGMLQ